MDEIGSSLRGEILTANVNLFKAYGIKPTPLPNGYVPVDIDVTPFDNAGTLKEGVSRTYKGYDGYALIMAYMGTEGFLVNCDCERETALPEPHARTSEGDFGIMPPTDGCPVTCAFGFRK
jgi:hypothetical protein